MRLIGWTMIVLCAGILAVLAVAGCGGGQAGPDDPVATLEGIIRENVDKTGETVSIADTSCVDAGGGVFKCLTTLSTHGESVKMAGTLTCDDRGCIWQGEQFAP